ncbi:MAG: helix-turn-helix transcriptional regulator [Halopseudomonas aestusnigri]
MKKTTKQDRKVGVNLKRIRQDRAKSQQQTADGVRITGNQIRKYESGIDRISSGRLAQVAEFLDTPVAEFYRGTSKAFTKDADAVKSARASRGKG